MISSLQLILCVSFLLPIDLDFVHTLKINDDGKTPWELAHPEFGPCPEGPSTAQKTLRKKIFCGYDTALRPVKKHTNVTNVVFNLLPVSFTFDEYSNIFELHCWAFMKWQDQHLTWKKEDYSGLENFFVKINEIWVPDITHFENGGGVTALPDTSCKLAYDGNVSCLLPAAFSQPCQADVTRWPFDKHNCTVRFGSWNHQGNELNLSYAQKMRRVRYKSDRYWTIVDFSMSRREEEIKANESWPFIMYSFVLERHSGYLIATMTVPAIVLMLVTLSTFWVDPNGPTRLILIGTNLIGHCSYMMFLGYYLPGNGDNTPLILTYFRDSYFLAGISLLISLCAGRMNSAARAPPIWITSITDIFVSSSPGQFLIQNDDDTKGLSSASETNESNIDPEIRALRNKWRQLATLLDRVSFLAFGVVLAILALRLIPGNENPTQTLDMFD